MPPQTTKEAVRRHAVRRVQEGLGMLQATTQPSPDQPRATDAPTAQNIGSLMHIPGASMHEILYTNGDNAPTPDRVVVPKIANGELYSKEALSKAHDGTVPENPLRERYDNYGNRWLEGGFEYPPYEGHGCAEGGTMTSDDVTTMGNEAEAKAGPSFRPNGDEKPVVSQESEQTGVPHTYTGPDSTAAFGGVSGHTGSRSDKWPAPGLTNFKPKSSNPAGNTNQGAGS